MPVPPPTPFLPTGDPRLAEALAAYVSPLVMENLPADFGPGAEAQDAAFAGAVLFTDIAGFTPLTGRMDTAGPDGVEDLSLMLNGYFTDLIHLIEAHGGQVVKFAGDALVAVWTGPAEMLAESAHRATQCAHFLQQHMPVRNPADGVALTMRMSLGAGEVRHMVLGGVGWRWLSRLAGPALANALEAVAQAEPGGVVLAPRMARLLAEAVKTSPLPAGAQRLDAVAPISIRPAMPQWVLARDAAAIFGHVPAAIRDRIVAGHSGWLAEFRTVTVLFIHVPEVDDSPARGLASAQACVRAIQTIIERFGGTVDDLGDDRAGLTLVAAFGLPPLAHEDDAVRAIRAALAVRGELRDLGFSPAIGVSTGRLFCGAIGSPRRRSYSMVGDAMNRCARLMARAQDDVLCDHATRQAAARRMRCDLLRAEELKGIAGAVAIYRPVGEVAAPPPERRGLMGRESERAILSARLTALHAKGEAGVVLIEGEAGIGKSALASEFRAMARDAGLRVVAGAGDSLESASGFRVWRSVFGEVLGFPPDADEAERAELLRLLVENLPEAARLAPLLNPALGLQLAENDITKEMTGRPRAEATTELLISFLQRATATEPLVVLLEDAHWADSPSLALALEVQRRVPRLLLVLAARPLDADAPETWTSLCAAAGFIRIVLGPLPAWDALALVRHRLGVDSLPASVERFICDKAEGHPFFSEELAFALRDAGHLVVNGRACALAPGVHDPGSLNFPVTVKGVVSARLDRLSDRERLAIKIASVTGRTFSLRTLLAIHPVAEDREHLPACLERLTALAFTRRTEAGGEIVFIFQHAIIQEVAYEQLPYARREPLHARLAEFIAEHDAANHPMLAHHWRNTATPLRAIPHLDRAGAEALQRFANREAANFLKQAIELSGQAAELQPVLTFGRWHRQIGEAQHRLGNTTESRQWLEKARRILGYPMPAPKRLKTLALPVAALQQLWNRMRGRGRTTRGKVPAAVLAEAIRADNQLGEIAYFANDLETSVFHIIHGLNLAESLGPSPQLAEMYAAMLILTGAMPLPALGRHYLGLTKRVLGQTSPPLTRAYVEQLMGIYFNGLGNFAVARTRLDSAMETFRRFGHGRRLEECWVNVFYLHIHTGKFAAARAIVEQLENSAKRRDDAQTMGWAALLKAHVVLPLEGPAAALAVLGDKVLPAWDPLTVTAFHAGRAISHFRLGEMDPAREHAQVALDRIAGRPPVSYTALLDCSHVAEVFLGLLSRTARDGGDTKTLAKQARRACQAMHAFGKSFAIGAPRALLWTGLEHLQRGHPSPAARSWQRGLTAAERLGMPSECALIKAQLAGAKADLPPGHSSSSSA